MGIVEESEATAVTFTTMGVIRRMAVREGQTVSQGQFIAEIDDSQARNMLSAAEAQMTQANDALERYTMLHDNGSLPEVQWVEIQSKVAQAQAQLEVAKKNLADCRITAPVSGIIGKRLLRSGETALPSQAVVTILNINTVKVKVSVPEQEINSIGERDNCHIEVDAAKKSTQGGLIEKGVQADALTHTYDIRINVSNPDRKLLPGMVASVTFDEKETTDATAILIPITSVQSRGDGSYFVWRIDADNSAHRQIVTVGPTFANSIRITSGLTSGQRIVTEGYQKLSEGTATTY